MVRFVHSDEIGVPPKRKQVSNACNCCRKRKRRCIHHNPLQASDGNQSIIEARAEGAGSSSHPQILPAVAHTSIQHAPPTSPLPRPQLSVPSGNASTGICSSSPTSSLGPALSILAPSCSAVPSSGSPSQTLETPETLESLESLETKENDSLKARFIGDMNVEGLLVEAVSSTSKRDSSNQGGVGIWISPSASTDSTPAITLAHRGLESVILPYIRDICLKVVPPSRDYIQLRRIFMDKIHPLFPVFDRLSLSLDVNGEDELLPTTVLMRQVISLAAGTDNEAGPYLRFEPNSPTSLSHAEFSATLTSAVRAIIDSGIISDRLVLARCLSLLSLYIHPPTSDQTDLPAIIGCRAIYYGQTMAVHIRGKTDEAEREMERLCLCLWAVDRLNGAFYGRPCLMHEMDFSRNLDDAISKQQPAFRLFLIVIKLLDGVITLYRPCAPTCDFFHISALEELIIGAGAARIPSTLLATIETFYNAVIILSCRMPSPGRDGRGAVPIPAASCRRSLAAERITFVVGKEFKGRLSPLPIVPYSVSLALSVAYRKMRYTRVPMYWTRSKDFFATNCRLLGSLGDLFWSAKALAALGDRVLREMERAMSSIVLDQVVGTAGHVSATIDAVDAAAVGGRETIDLSNIDAGTAVIGGGTAGPPLGVGRGATSFGAVASQGGVNVETSFFDSFPDMDLFGHLDPGFNLDAVDAALEANLDLGLQVHWPDWGDWET